MRFQLDEYHRGVSDEELLSELRRIASSLKKDAVTRNDNDDYGKYGTTTYIRRFGSWFSALDMAGLQKTRTPANVPEEDLFHNLEEIWAYLGRQPRYAEVQSPLSRYSAGTYENRYGTYRKALEAFVKYINTEQDGRHMLQAHEPLASDPVEGHRTKRGVNWRLRFVVMNRDNFKCKACGRSPATDPEVILHVDHIKAWAKGGETVIENLQTLCSVCNIGKSDLNLS